MHQGSPSTNSALSELSVHPTRDGSNTIFSYRFGAAYHSLFGAVSESRHVFIQFGLAALAPTRPVRILEFGFGTGLNALLALEYAQRHEWEIRYTGIESVAIPESLLARLDYPGYMAHPELTEIFRRMHAEASFEVPGFSFNRLEHISAATADAPFHCIFLDAFAPAAQPECWSQPTFDELYAMTEVDGMLVTYCAQGEVRRRMQHAGFVVERIPGPIGKREMLRARKSA